MISINKRVIENLNKKENYLKNLGSKLLEKEKYSNNLLQKIKVMHLLENGSMVIIYITLNK